MKKWILTCFLFLFTQLSFAVSFDKIVFFGDSLSDNGNLFRAVFGIIPKEPPYYQGRFSNGPTWAEYVANYYYKKGFLKSENYAYGGATALLHVPTPKFIAPTILPLEIKDYLLMHLFQSKDSTLFFLWIGGNDYFFGNDYPDQEELTNKVITAIGKAVDKLIENGAKKLVIVNLPDLSITPFAKQHNMVKRLKELTLIHNQKLAEKVVALQKHYPAVQFLFVDVFQEFGDVVHNPIEFNKRYGVNITNTIDMCWEGGYLFKAAVKKQDLAKQLTLAIAAKTNAQQDFDKIDAISDLILQNPILAATYAGSLQYEQGLTPCQTPNQYVFWDDVHPSAIIHKVVGEEMVEKVDIAFTN